MLYLTLTNKKENKMTCLIEPNQNRRKQSLTTWQVTPTPSQLRFSQLKVKFQSCPQNFSKKFTQKGFTKTLR